MYKARECENETEIPVFADLLPRVLPLWHTDLHVSLYGFCQAFSLKQSSVFIQPPAEKIEGFKGHVTKQIHISEFFL